ncbi:CoA pyrophosphatase [Clostridium aestuarii]|uniref:CoA pyrophosphatase n=1 Tax=Clostridium aestuarii TaxID=338193 RepID=A0ABT4D072_9CLOT|nr:CoA pyrophosphatase [Clostridium aestuarii]
MESIRKIFNDRKIKPIGEYRKSAVMVLLVEENNELYIVFEKRALTLKHQPGDISLPGGMIEKNETSREAAVRETIEELNVKKSDIEVIGQMDYFISPYSSIMYPFIGQLHTKDIKPNKDEVEHIFTVPLKFFLENQPACHKFKIKPHFQEDFPFELIYGGKNYKFSTKEYNQYFYKYKDYVIWGFTALIIKSFVDTL